MLKSSTLRRLLVGRRALCAVAPFRSALPSPGAAAGACATLVPTMAARGLSSSSPAAAAPRPFPAAGDASSAPLMTPALAATLAAALAGAATVAATTDGDSGGSSAVACANTAGDVDRADTPEHQRRVDEALGKLRAQFNCSTAVLNNIAKRMNTEMLRGLSKTEGSEIKMLPSYVRGIPSGKERGDFLALDLGGSNFRVVAFGLSPDEGVRQLDARKVTIPAKLMTDACDASELFGFIADQVGEAPGAKDQSTPNLKLGFTFSFPVNQKSINEGDLVHWTKGFATRDCEGEEVVRLLQNAFQERDISVDVAALVNDTVGTLVAHAVEDSRTQVGVILGTGCNACYVEKVANIVKLEDTTGDPDANMVSSSCLWRECLLCYL